MSKRLSTSRGADGFISEREAWKLLEVLCVKYGFCLPPLWQARLEKNPPRSIDKFTDAVFHAEGLNPTTADSDLYRWRARTLRQPSLPAQNQHPTQSSNSSSESDMRTLGISSRKVEDDVMKT